MFLAFKMIFFLPYNELFNIKYFQFNHIYSLNCTQKNIQISYKQKLGNSSIFDHKIKRQMSNKSKDKKPEELLELQKKFDIQKHQNLQLSVMNKKLQEISIVAKKQLELFQRERLKNNQKAYKKIQQLELTNSSLAQRLNQIRQQREEFEIENGCLKYKLQKLQKSFDEYKLFKQRETDQYKKYVNAELTKYQNIVTDYHGAIKQRLNYVANNQQLQKKLERQDVEYKKVSADKDRDKIQAIDQIKKEMFQKSRQMRANLLSMRRQQMATNTRLTVLQNQQLLEELQYQSKNTDKIIKKNLQLEKKVRQLSNQLQIQKQIQKQLATRTAISKKIVKNLNQKNTALQVEIKRNSIANTRTSEAQSLLQRQVPAQKLSSEYTKTVNLLQQQLLIYQNQIEVLEKQRMHYKQLYQTFQPQYQFYLKSQNDLRILMIKYYQNLLQGKVTNEQSETVYDISRLKNIHVNQWSKSDIQITIKMLLTFLKPHFIMKNMKSSYLKVKQHLNLTPNINEMLPEIKDMSLKQAQKKLKSKSLSSQYAKLFKKSMSKQRLRIQHVKANCINERSRPKRQLSLHASMNLKNDGIKLLKKQKTKSQHNLSQQESIYTQQLKQNDYKAKISKPFREWGNKVKILKQLPTNANFQMKSFSRLQKKSKLLSTHAKFQESSNISQNILLRRKNQNNSTPIQIY